MPAVNNILKNLCTYKAKVRHLMELYGRSALDSFQSGNKLLRHKGSEEKDSNGVDDLKLKDATKKLLDSFNNNIYNYNKNKENILDNTEDIND